MTFAHPVIRINPTRRVAAGLAAALLVLLSAVGCGGGESSAAIDPANELPFGSVDLPPAGSQLLVQASAGGWAMDDRGIREVRLYIDNRFVKSTKLNTERPDVSKAFPKYARNTNLHGWTMTFEFYSGGAHALLLQAVDTDGATRDIGVVNVTSHE